MKRFVIGDIHGQYNQLEKVLKLCDFDFDNDLLITLGDIVDRGKDWRLCLDILFKVKNRIDIRGNHDHAFYNYIINGEDWFGGRFGADVTISQWLECSDSNKLKYNDFFKNQIPYYILDNKCFVHGGFDTKFKIEENSESTLYWDRELLEKSLIYPRGQKMNLLNDFERIFIGHTPTLSYGLKDVNPTFSGGLIWNIDTGCGKGGLLTIMNIDTEEFFQG